MRKKRWAQIVHNILLLKSFTFEHLKAISCDKGVHSQSEEVTRVISELMTDGFLESEGELYSLTADFDKRLDLLEMVRKIERGR